MGNQTISVIALPGTTPDLNDDVDSVAVAADFVGVAGVAGVAVVAAAAVDVGGEIVGAGWPCHRFRCRHRHCCCRFHLPVGDPLRGP